MLDEAFKNIPKTLSCPNCNQTFGTKDAIRPHGPRLPLLLSCGHTFCEGCLTKLAKTHKLFVPCPSCQRATTLVAGCSLKGICPDIYILGLLAVYRRVAMSQEHSFEFKSRLSIEESLTDTTKEEMCSECTRKPATCKCVKCDCVLCGSCFDVVHRSSRTLRKHQAVPLHASADQNPLMCAAHDGRPIEYFCEDDATPICSHCVIMGDHKQHAISSMEERNKKTIEDLGPAIEQAHVVFQRMRYSDRILSHAVPGVKTKVSQLTDDIRQQFAALHRALQAREAELLHSLNQTVQCEANPLEETRKTLLKDMKSVEAALKEGRQLVNDGGRVVVNAQAMLDRLRDADNLPSVALRMETQKEATPLRFSMNEDLMTLIQSAGSVEGHTGIRVTVKALSEVPEEILPPMDDLADTASSSRHSPDSTSSLYTENGLSDAADGESDSQSVSSSHSRASRRLQPKIRLNIPRPTRRPRAKQQTVYVTHIKSPAKFMVQSADDMSDFQKMTRQIRQHCAQPPSAGEIPALLHIGDDLLAQYSQDNVWYRAKVIEVTYPEEALNPEDQVKVVFVDYGNTDLVTADRIRTIPGKFLKLPAQARECTLFDIVPAGEDMQWSAEAIRNFALMTGDKPMLLTVMSETTEGVANVDLSKPGADAIEDDRPISVRDALVFLELACFVSPMSVPSPDTGLMPKPKRQFISPEMPSAGESFVGVITHSQSPDRFYMQKVGAEVHYLTEMALEMQATYSKKSADLYAVFLPQKGQVCVSQFSVDNAWYRALVTGLPGRAEVQVLYVDYGNVERVSYLRLRKILDKFLILPTQAISCKLADVCPPGGLQKKWSQEAVDFMAKQNFKQVSVQVQATLGNRLLDVVVCDELDVLNTQLVDQGLAVSTGPCSLIQPSDDTGPTAVPDDRGSKLPVSGVDIEADSKLAISMMTKKETEAPSVRQSAKASRLNPDMTAAARLVAAGNRLPTAGNMAVRGGSQAAVTGNQPASQAGPKPGLLRQESWVEVPDSHQVVVSHTRNPGHFYLQMASVGQDTLYQLMEDLDAAAMARSTSVSLAKWQEGACCAARRAEDQLWYRAKIISLAQDGKAKVLMLDYGYEEELDVGELRPLLARLVSIPSCCFRCHMAEVQPAGDISRWSQTSIEFMAEKLCNTPSFIVSKGPVDERGSLPVDLLLQEVVQGDALSSDQVNFKSFQQMLLDRGLALPKRSMRRPAGSGSGTSGGTTSGESTPSQTPGASSPLGPPTRGPSASSSAPSTPKAPSPGKQATSGASSPRPDSQSPVAPKPTSSPSPDSQSSVALKPTFSPNTDSQSPVALKPTSSPLSGSQTPVAPKPTSNPHSGSQTPVGPPRVGVASASPRQMVKPGSGSLGRASPRPSIITQIANSVSLNSMAKSLDSAVNAKPDEAAVAEARLESGLDLGLAIAPLEGAEEDEESDSPIGDPPKTPPAFTPAEDELAPVPTHRHIEYQPPDEPVRRLMTVVPTYVDYSALIYVQEVQPDESQEGKLGFFLKENTIEVVLQDAYLAQTGLRRFKIVRDGNCLFRALAAALWRDQGRHAETRRAVCGVLRRNWFLFENVMAGQSREDYLAAVERDGSYGGEPEIQAACHGYGLRVKLFLGGLESNVVCRSYGGGNAAQASGGEENSEDGDSREVDGGRLVRLSYVSDGLYDNGHYDLVVACAEDEGYQDDGAYIDWRQTRIEDFRKSERFSDNKVYEHSILQQLMDVLQKRFRDSSPPACPTWSVGQSMVARYTLDDMYYRARITDITESGFKVMYVDFGNSEVIPASRLRDHVALPDIPQQCIPCVLANIAPVSEDGRWSVPVLDKIHGMVVGKTCTLDVLSVAAGPVLTVDLWLPNGALLTDLLQATGMARDQAVPAAETAPGTAPGTTPGSVPGPGAGGPAVGEAGTSLSAARSVRSEPAPEPEPETDAYEDLGVPQRSTASPFSPLVRPASGDLMLVSVTQVDAPDTVYIQHVSQDDAKEPHFTAINKELDLLLQLSDYLNSNCHHFLPLDRLAPGSACCAQYSVDGSWYRAEILNTNQGPEARCGTLFVDYGSSEYVTKESVRELPEECLELPAQALKCRLEGVQRPKGGWQRPDFVQLSSLVASKVLIAVVKSVDEDDVTVVLYDHEAFAEQGVDAPLVYHSMLPAQPDSDSSVIIEESYVESGDELDAAPEQSSRTWADVAGQDLGPAS